MKIQSAYKKSKYGHNGLHEMVDTHFMQLETKIKLQGLTEELAKESDYLNKIYKPFLTCECQRKSL